jgi:predicted nucleic acid-binding protein
MDVVVFDADVLIGFLNQDDGHHADAVERVRASLGPGTRRLVAAPNYSEVLIGPLQARGPAGADTVDAMLTRLGVEITVVDAALARRAAIVRARTGLKLPDAYALGTAIHTEQRTNADVRLETFDKRVVKAYEELRSS